MVPAPAGRASAKQENQEISMDLTSAELGPGSAELRSGSAELGSAPAELQILGKSKGFLLKSSRSSLRAGSETRRGSLGSSAGLRQPARELGRTRLSTSPTISGGAAKKSILGVLNGQRLRPPISVNSSSPIPNLFELDADLDSCGPNSTFECQSFATQVGICLSAHDPGTSPLLVLVSPPHSYHRQVGYFIYMRELRYVGPALSATCAMRNPTGTAFA